MAGTALTLPAMSLNPTVWRRHPFVLLLAALLVCTPPCLMGLFRTDATNHMEVLSLVTSQETWLRQRAGDSQAWLSPSWNGELRVRKPPLTVWLHLLAWSGMEQDAPVASLVARARATAAAAAALLLTATFWIGWQAGGRRGAVAAVLTTGTMLLFTKQARLASYDIHLAAWSTLSVACGWASLRHTGSGRGAAWRALAAAVSLGAACLSKSPIALLFVGLALAVETATSPRRATALRRSAAILLSGCALALPWYAWVAIAKPGAGLTLVSDYASEPLRPKPPWYYASATGYVFPWCVPFLAALVYARRHAGAAARRANPHWWWFVLALVCLSIPGAKRPRYLLPIFPAIGLLVADAWLAAGETARRRSTRVVDAVHAGVLAVISLAPAAAVLLRSPLLPRGIGQQAILAQLWPPAAVAATVALLACAAATHLACRRQARLAGLWFTALWTAVLGAWAAHSYANSAEGRFAAREDSLRVSAVIGDQPVAYLRADRSDLQPDAKFLLYTRRIVPAILPGGLPGFASSGGTGAVYVIARDSPAHEEILRGVDFEPVQSYVDGGRQPRRLYRSPLTAPP